MEHLIIRIMGGVILLFLLLDVVCATYVHFRGRKRHKFKRQLTDHSTFMAPYNSLIYMFSAVPNTPVQKLENFPDLKPLQENWEIIRDEARRLYEEGHIRPSESKSDLAFNSFFKRGWKRFYLKWYDDFLPSAREICPKTVELVEKIPSVNAALFALLPGKSRLGEHRDPFAGSLRYHLGLMTPNSDACRIYIDGEPYAWRDGQAVLFDETYIHSVVNDTDKDRLILFCDVTRPIENKFVWAINNFAIQRVVRATAAHNWDTEKIGALNRVTRHLFGLQSIGEKLKKKNRRAYKLVSQLLTYGAMVIVVGAILYVTLRRH